MKRIIIAGTVALLIATVIGTGIIKDEILQAFASSDVFSQLIRVVLIGLLTVLLITNPPRSLHFRTGLGIASALLTLGVAVMLSQYGMALLDALVFVEVAIIFALEAFESPVFTTDEKKVQGTYQTQKKKVAI